MSVAVPIAVLLAAPDFSDSSNVITALVVGLVCIGVWLVFYTVVQAFILQLACRIISVPVPGLGGAVGVEVASALLNFLLYLALGAVTVFGAASKGPLTEERMQFASLTTFLFYLPLSAIVSAGTFASLLDEVGFGQGLLIWLIQGLFTFLIGFVLFFVLLFAIVFLGVFAGAAAHR